MRVRFIRPNLPRQPLLRFLVVAGMAIVVAALLATGLVLGVIALATAALVLAARRWLARRAPRTADPSIIEGEFTVVRAHPRTGLPHPE